VIPAFPQAQVEQERLDAHVEYWREQLRLARMRAVLDWVAAQRKPSDQGETGET
jgi:hypothetical protein